MIDRELFLFINGLSGKVPAIDGFFRGFSNDYTAIISSCLVLIYLWFSVRDAVQREKTQKAVITVAISIGLTSLLVLIINTFYFRTRPFNELPADSINLLFYRPTDSSFPSNLAAVVFAIVVPIFMANKKAGGLLLAIATLSSFGRVYIGIHYPLDVIGGAIFGTAGAFLAYIVSKWITPWMDAVIGFIRKFNLA